MIKMTTICGLLATVLTASFTFAAGDNIKATCEIDPLILINVGGNFALQVGGAKTIEIDMKKLSPGRLTDYEGYSEIVIEGNLKRGNKLIDIGNDGQHKIAIQNQLEVRSDLKILTTRVVVLEKKLDGTYSAVSNNYISSLDSRQYLQGKLMTRQNINDYRSADIRLKLCKEKPIRLESEEPAVSHREIEVAMERGLLPENYISHLKVQCTMPDRL